MLVRWQVAGGMVVFVEDAADPVPARDSEVVEVGDFVGQGT